MGKPLNDSVKADTAFKPTVAAAMLAVAARNVLLLGGTLFISLVYFWLEPAGSATWIVPIAVFAGLWLVLFGLNDRADHRAILETGHPRPGQWAAVCGTARALEKVSGDILACRFQVFDEQRGIQDKQSKNLSCRFDGFFLTPTVIETENGNVALGGFPDLIHLDKTPLSNELLVRAKAAAEVCPPWVPKSLARELALAGIADSAETSLRYGVAEEASAGTTKSWVLRPGDQVCVFGLWKDGTLVRSRNRPRGLPVYVGSRETVRERLEGDSNAFLIMGAVFLLAAAGVAGWSFL